LVVAAGLIVFMAALDMSIVNVALPAISADVGLEPGAVAWVVLGYILPIVALGLPSGRWLDQVGKRAAFVFLVSGFALASALAGAAPNAVWLIGARIAQGAFGAALFSLISVLVVMATKPEVRGRAMGVVATVGPLGAVSGPPIGGVLVGTLGWPAIFYVNIPVSLVVIALALRALAPDGGLRWPDRQWLSEAALIGGAATAVLLALSQAPTAGFGWLALLLAAVPPLWLWRRRPASRPVVELLGSPSLRAAIASLALLAAAGAVIQFLGPFFLEGFLQRSPEVTGLTILAFPLAMAVLGPVGGALADRWGSRRMVLAGSMVMTAAMILFVPLGSGWQLPDLIWRLALLGAGMGLFAGPNQALAMSLAPPQLMATTGAATSVARSLGFALGPAVGAASWALTGYTLPGMRGGIAAGAAMAALAAVLIALARPRPQAVPAVATADPAVADPLVAGPAVASRGETGAVATAAPTGDGEAALDGPSMLRQGADPGALRR
jgi:DHA2 family multidrug resistance protein-like MFS transporter